MPGIKALHLVGGNAALDFANSVNAHASHAPRDTLHSYADMLLWGERAGVLTREQKRALSVQSADDPQGAVSALKQGVLLREAIFRLFLAVARGETQMGAALGEFNAFVERFLPLGRIVRKGRAFDIDFDPQSRLEGLLAVIAWSAVELLRSDEIARVKVCGEDTCGWLFVDRSKNHSRRWCEMSDCGNTVKARKFRERRRKH